MGTNYNITPKQFNGSDYDTLYFKNTSQQSLLNDNAFATLLGLSTILNPNPNVNVNDALKAVLSSTVYAGSYSGGNEYGSTNPNQISVSFVPKIIIIGIDASYSGVANSFGIIPYSCKCVTQDLQSLSTTWTTEGNTTTVSWYSSSNADAQLNASGVTYYWYALR